MEGLLSTGPTPSSLQENSMICKLDHSNCVVQLSYMSFCESTKSVPCDVMNRPCENVEMLLLT